MHTVNKKQQGFSMIEVLVSLIVIGVGMLGLSGLQIASMKGTNNAHSRNVASMLIMGLGDKMRANPTGADGGFYDNDVNCTKNETQCRTNTFCSPEKIARLDVQEIMCGIYKSGKREGGVQNLIPGGVLSITCPDGCNVGNAEHTVSISWSGNAVHQDQSGDDLEYSVESIIIP
ncbi:type IV pilus modification protein PilV [uncultured Cocleimonas sp.]|uniref:type IV pilus modification protein PilV n=1 Tax=uncultured Cocleimonas sp. TaxID=1051587 RepID=UPI002629A89D|nr:type IV pilus modification protein PilV [uncultured Cocleimonas sp.]